MEKQIELKSVDGVVVATSINLSNVICIEHKKIIKTIRYLVSIGIDEKNFKKISNESNKKKYYYNISKDGITFLVDIIDKVNNLKMVQKGLEMFDKN